MTPFIPEMENIDKSLLKILRNKSQGTVAIFERGDKYSCYEDDAKLLANDVFNSDIGIRCFMLGGNRLSYLNLNSSRYVRVLRELLLILRYRVELYTSTEDEWVLQAKGSLGNLGDFEEVLSDCVELSELATIMCAEVVNDVKRNQQRVAVAFCNVQALRFTYAEFIDTEHLPQLERCIVSLCPRECVVLKNEEKDESALNTSNLLPKASSRFSGIEATLTRANVDRTEATTEPMSDREFRGLFADADFTQLTPAVERCLYTLAGHMLLGEDSNYIRKFALVRYASAGYMHLDAAAVHALELFSVSYDDLEVAQVNESGTVYDMLNKCRSLPGQRLLREWLRRPLADRRRILERQEAVHALCEAHSERSLLHDDLLRRVPDLPLLVRKVVQKKAGLQDVHKLFQAVQLITRFESAFSNICNYPDCAQMASTIRELILEPLKVAGVQFERFVSLIDAAIDIEHAEKTGEYRIKPDVDTSLQETAQRMKDLAKKAQKSLNSICEETGIEQVSCDRNDQYGYFYRVPIKEEKTIRGFKYTILDINKGSGCRFTTSYLESVNAEQKILQTEYEKAQASLIKKVVETCNGYLSPVHQLSAIFALIDVLVCFAEFASSSSFTYVQPEILEKGTGVLELTQCRHPVIELLPEVRYMANDIHLGNDAGNGKRFLVITGANMGGKSTYLRSTALAVLLAQIGCRVPCDRARLSLVDGIHTRVGATDFQFKGMSTFMTEMVDSAAILETATENSLVIVDELGRGTSTYDGFGLAYAIAEDLQRIGCFVLFATHFHEMALLAERSDPHGRVRCVRTEAEVNEGGELVLLYKIADGVAERSFGIQCARLVGFPDEVIESAEAMLQVLSSRNSLVPMDTAMSGDEPMDVTGKLTKPEQKNGDEPMNVDTVEHDTVDHEELEAAELLKRWSKLPVEQLRQSILDDMTEIFTEMPETASLPLVDFSNFHTNAEIETALYAGITGKLIKPEQKKADGYRGDTRTLSKLNGHPRLPAACLQCFDHLMVELPSDIALFPFAAMEPIDLIRRCLIGPSGTIHPSRTLIRQLYRDIALKSRKNGYVTAKVWRLLRLLLQIWPPNSTELREFWSSAMAFPGCDVNDMPALLRHLLARIGELTSIARGGFDSETLEELEFWVEFLEFDMASFAANNRKDQWMEEWEAMPQEKVALIDMCKKLSDKSPLGAELAERLSHLIGDVSFG